MLLYPTQFSIAFQVFAHLLYIRSALTYVSAKDGGRIAMNARLLLMFVITTWGISYSDAHAYNLTLEWSRVGGGALLILCALGAVQSVYDIVTKMSDINQSPEREELWYRERYILPSMFVANRKKLVKDAFITEEGAGFRTGMDGLVRIFLAKKGWDLMWHDQEEREQPYTQQAVHREDEG